MPTDELSATDRARLQKMRRELRALLQLGDQVTELFTASCTAYREQTGLELDPRDPAVHLTERDKLRALELYRASRSGSASA